MYFIRKMHGSFISKRLLKTNVIPEDHDDDPEESILAVCVQIPHTRLSKYLIPDHDNETFDEHWFDNTFKETEDGHRLGGHHSGKCHEIIFLMAESIIRRVENEKH